MIYINITETDDIIILNCNKKTKDGEPFQLIIDKKTGKLIQKPEYPDIDASAAYSRIYSMMKTGEPLPKETIAAWG